MKLEKCWLWVQPTPGWTMLLQQQVLMRNKGSIYWWGCLLTIQLQQGVLMRKKKGSIHWWGCLCVRQFHSNLNGCEVQERSSLDNCCFTVSNAWAAKFARFFSAISEFSFAFRIIVTISAHSSFFSASSRLQLATPIWYLNSHCCQSGSNENKYNCLPIWELKVGLQQSHVNV